MDVADKIDLVIRQFYRPARETPHSVDYSDNIQYWSEGDPANQIIQEIAGVEDDVSTEIVRILHQQEWRDVSDGDEAYYDDEPLEHVSIYPHEFMDDWLRFEGRLKHEIRFFDDEGKQMLDRLFADMASIADGKAIVTLQPGGEFATIYRARIAEGAAKVEEFILDPAKNVGPPPPYLARSGRMNPAGISVFYGGFSEQVVISEVRPPVGSLVVVGRFSLLQPLRLLDLSFLPFAYHRESIFSPRYESLIQKVRFLAKFHRRISRPVLPTDEELEYLPTQAIAAYFANVMKLDGVIYASTQVGAERVPFEQVKRELCNVALFGQATIVEGVSPQATADDAIDLQGPLNASFSAEFGGTTVTPTTVDPMEYPNVATERVPIAVDTAPTVPAARLSPTNDRPPAVLRHEGEPTVIKVRAVTVETSPVFAHRYPDGKVLINDYDDEDEDDE